MLDGETHHTVVLDGAGAADFRAVVGFFARQILHDLRLVGGYDLLYGKLKAYMRERLFRGAPVDLEDPVILRNLAEPEVGKLLHERFVRAINGLTVRDAGSARIEDRIRLRDTRPFRTDPREYYPPRKSVFNKIVGEPHAGKLELAFARFLDDAPDVAAFAKNYMAVGFKLDYVRSNGELSNYVPDFVVRSTGAIVYVIETKGREELDLPAKMARLAQWCRDASDASRAEGGPDYRFVFVDQAGFEAHRPTSLASLVAAFTDFQPIADGAPSAAT
jgi:type III restriction enzyme